MKKYITLILSIVLSTLALSQTNEEKSIIIKTAIQINASLNDQQKKDLEKYYQDKIDSMKNPSAAMDSTSDEPAIRLYMNEWASKNLNLDKDSELATYFTNNDLRLHNHKVELLIDAWAAHNDGREFNEQQFLGMYKFVERIMFGPSGDTPTSP
jgi:hypothetical protein